MSNGAAATPTEERAAPRATSSRGRRSAPAGSKRSPARGYAVRPPPAGNGLAARIFGLVGISLGTHMALVGVLGFMPAPAAFARKEVEMDIIEPEPPPPPPPPPAAQAPKAQEPARPKLAPKPAAPKPEPTPPKAQQPAASEAPVDLTGVTLTGGDGASWSSVVGNGAALQGPAGRIGKVTGRDRAGTSTGVVNGKGTAPLVSEASLSRKPIPPEGMDALLEQNFPPRARAQGVSGTALLRVRIHPDGRVGDMQIVRETGDYGFGTACMKTLRERRWQPPLDRRGTPVATEIRYSCEFEVGY